MKSTYKNSIKSRQQIRDALFELLRSGKDITEISICDIVETAKINRGTFYNHYNSVGQILAFTKAELMAKLSNDLTINFANSDIEHFISATLTHIKNNLALYRQLAYIYPAVILQDIKIELDGKLKTLPNTYTQLQKMFLLNGFVGSILDFLTNNTELTLDNIAQNAIDYFNKKM